MKTVPYFSISAGKRGRNAEVRSRQARTRVDNLSKSAVVFYACYINYLRYIRARSAGDDPVREHVDGVADK